ncbi:hypothetical protein Tco_1355397 [Tanacetum coccineum]
MKWHPKVELQEVEGDLVRGKDERDRHDEKSESLVREIESLWVKNQELQRLLAQEEQKTATVKEKLKVAFRKGKYLVQDKRNTLSMILGALAKIDLGVELINNDLFEKMKQIEKVMHDLQVAISSAEQESRKSRTAVELLLAELNEVQERNEDLLEELSKTIMEKDSAEFELLLAELLLAELNEVQERNEDLLEELSKTIMEKDSAEFAKSKSISHLEQLSALHWEERNSKFDGKADEGFFVGYSVNSKAFRVFNSRTRIVEETLHITFLENKPNVAGSGPTWLFDIDTLTKSMNYKPVIAGNQSNGNAGTKENIGAGQVGKKTVPDQEYILLPLWTSDPSLSKGPKNTEDYAGKKVTEVPETESGVSSKEDDKDDQDLRNEFESLNGENDVNIMDLLMIQICLIGRKNYLYMIDDEDVDVEADMTNLDTDILVSPTPTTRIHKDHPLT